MIASHARPSITFITTPLGAPASARSSSDG